MLNARQFFYSTLVLTLGAAGQSAHSENSISTALESNEILVKYRDDTFRTHAMMENFYQEVGTEQVTYLDGLASNIEKMTLEDHQAAVRALAEVRRNPMVEFAQIDHLITIPRGEGDGFVIGAPRTGSGACWADRSQCGGGGGVKFPEILPAPAEVQPPVADPRNAEVYALEKVAASQAWALGRGTKQIVVADIDTGVDYNHEDLSFNMWRNPDSTKPDVVGYNFVHNNHLPFDDNGHGTHTSGTIGAVGENGKGIVGIAPRVSIMALKFLAGNGSGSTSNAIKAIDYAIKNGAKIMSNSWGSSGGGGNGALQEIIRQAESRGILFVAAAGNESKDNDGTKPSYPASFNLSNMLSVAATDEADEIAKFSNFGLKSVHLGAPGVKVLSTTPGNQYKAFSGTSMATPAVAGAAALVWAQNPEWTYREVKEALLNSVDKVPALEGKTTTGGRLNVLKAVNAAKRSVGTPGTRRLGMR